MNKPERDTKFETFNRRFNTLFMEDCCDADGRLPHIRQGKLRLGLICSYLSKLDWGASFPLDLVEIKLLHLKTKLTYLTYVYNIAFRFETAAQGCMEERVIRGDKEMVCIMHYPILANKRLVMMLIQQFCTHLLQHQVQLHHVPHAPTTNLFLFAFFTPVVAGCPHCPAMSHCRVQFDFLAKWPSVHMIITNLTPKLTPIFLAFTQFRVC